MKIQHSFVELVGLSLIVGTLAVAAEIETTDPATPSPTSTRRKPAEKGQVIPKAQIAILLDNSGSMSGLLEQAKSELWKTVNELITARRRGKTPQLEVALYTYGEPPAQLLVPLTDNLDIVSERLFAISIDGGTEYCGQTIAQATNQLAWSSSNDDLKLIFIAGNEPFSQGPVDYREACRAAIAKGIIVNTIHCGSGIPDDWREGALLADGKAASIDQNQQVVHIDAPQDAEIVRLGAALNDTYVPYGRQGSEGQMRQSVQDSNAAGVSSANAAQRSIAKANTFYRNHSWDLVDALRDGQVRLEKLNQEDLPEIMRPMSPQEQKSYLDTQLAKRQRIQERINTLSEQRRQFVARKRKEQAEAGADTLDQALTATVREQAIKKSFSFDAPMAR